MKRIVSRPAFFYVYSWLLPAIAHFYKKQSALLFLIVLAPFSSLFGQEISIKNIELDGDHVFISYSLIDSTLGRKYTVNLFSSKDNFATPLRKINSDIGIEIQPGINKKIDWNAKEEFGHDFEGKVAFEIRSKIYIPFLALKEFDFKKLKRGNAYEITWSGGRPQNILNFDLCRGEKCVASFSNIANMGHYTLVIPMHVKPGDGYQFKISDTKNKDELIHSGTFSIVRKAPLLLKVMPVVMLGVAGYFVWGNPTDPHKNDIDPFPTVH